MSSKHHGLIALIVAFCLPATAAHATVVRGSVEDPVRDVRSAEGYVPMNDLTALAVTYDSAGRVDLSVRYAAYGRPADGIHSPHPDFWVSATLGIWDVASGRCAGGAVVAMYEGPAIPHTRAQLIGSSEELRNDGLTYDTAAARFSGSVAGAALARRSYDCVTSVVSTAHETTDTAASFCMGPGGKRSCPVPAPPEVAWVSPRNGQTISGVYSEGGANNCLVRVSGPVARTENYVDGRLHDTQVNPPWACEWDTRDVANGVHRLTVKAYDADGRLLAQDTITVTVQNSVTHPDPHPGPRPDPHPAPGTPDPDGDDPSSDEPPTGTPGPTPPTGGPRHGDPPFSAKLTETDARRLALSAVRHRYGWRTYRVSCAVAPAGFRADCRVTWRRGNRVVVRITRTAARDRVTIRR